MSLRSPSPAGAALVLFATAFLVRPPAARAQAFEPIAVPSTGVAESAVAWGDADADGDLDLLFAGHTGTSRLARLYLNDGGVFAAGAGFAGVSGGAASWADVDGDGDLDLLLTGLTDAGLGAATLYRNDGGAFTDAGAGLPGVRRSAAAWGDADNDGDLDLLLSGQVDDGGLLSEVFRNDDGAFTAFGAGLPGLADGSAAWGDYDGDGDLDILLTGAGAGGAGAVAAVYRSEAGVFTEIDAGLVPVAASSAAWGDYDNDGDLDVALSGETDAGALTTRIYRNEAGAFVDIAAPLVGASEGSLAWGDFDSDGDLDLLLTGRTCAGRVAAVYRNDAGAFVALAATGLSGVSRGAAVWGDFDDDGRLDIAMAGDAGWTFGACVYRNMLLVPNTAPSAPAGLSSSVDGVKVVLSWSAAADAQTPAAGLTYNLRLGRTAGAEDVAPSMASLADGYRRIPALGNVQHGASAWIGALAPGTYSWTVQAIDPAFAGSPFASEGTFTVAPCSYALQPSAASLPAAGGSGSFEVITGAGCAWTASPIAGWIDIVGVTSGIGSGTVRYSVGLNGAGPRSGEIAVADQAFTVTQAAAGCSYAIDPVQASFTEMGGTGTFTVEAPAWCGWEATSGAAWLTITAGARGTGTGPVSYTVAENTWVARQASIGVAGLSHQVSQARQPVGPQRVWHNWFAVDPLEMPYVGDFNGDGRADIITFTRQNPLASADVYVAFSNGRQFVNKDGIPDSSDKWHDWFAISEDETVVIGDYDGDGKDDIAITAGTGTKQVYVALSYGVGMMPEVLWAGGIGSDPNDVLLSGDVNGDGKADLLCFARSQGRVFVALSDGSHFAAPVEWHGFFCVSAWERPGVADVDGDGRADILTFGTDSPTAYGDVYVALSDGARFVDGAGKANSSMKWHDWFAVDPRQQVRTGDIDADGRADLFTFMPAPFGQCYTVLSTGAGLGPNVLWRETVAPLPTDFPRVGDANGDGQADIIVFAQGEGKVYVSLAP